MGDLEKIEPPSRMMGGEWRSEVEGGKSGVRELMGWDGGLRSSPGSAGKSNS